jgi:hypothetical protein
VASIRDFVSRELDLHVAYYEEHPSFVRRWFGGRISPTVAAEVRNRNAPWRDARGRPSWLPASSTQA